MGLNGFAIPSSYYVLVPNIIIYNPLRLRRINTPAADKPATRMADKFVRNLV
jgi:hypothetical protein